MSKKRRAAYVGCFVQVRNGTLWLRYRWQGRERCVRTRLTDAPENRETLAPLTRLVGAAIGAGKDPTPILTETLGVAHAGSTTPTSAPTGPTVAAYYRDWYAERKGQVRKAQARKYRQHMEDFVLPALGSIPLAAIRTRDVRGLQADLLGRVSEKTGKPFSVKTVKNILAGSFAAMLRQARSDELLAGDPIAGLEWARWNVPDADPFDEDERDAIIAWFKAARYADHAGPKNDPRRVRPHPPYHAYVHFLFWHGVRPSEASGLRWKHVDLRKRTANIRESYHEGRYEPPKTKAARRTIELHPEAVRLLRVLQPAHVTPDAPVFTSLAGTPVEPKTFSEHWYDCLRALKLRVRGLYCTKDSFVTVSFQRMPDNVLWVERMTGVAYATLRKHYAAWLPQASNGVWDRLTPANCGREGGSASAIAVSA